MSTSERRRSKLRFAVNHLYPNTPSPRSTRVYSDCVHMPPGAATCRLVDNARGACNELDPPHAGLRLVAGGPLSNDVFKCRLKPIDYGDYAVEFTDAEKRRLESIFDQGVCDWSRPGVHQAVNRTWLSYGPSPVNRYEPGGP